MFKHTREKFPNSTLMFNDYNHESRTGAMTLKSDAVYDFVKGLVDRGCGIDVVGFQSHFEAKDVVDSEFLNGIKTNIQRYSDLGLKVHISELDVVCKKGLLRWGQQDKCATNQPEQDQGFVNVLDVCL